MIPEEAVEAGKAAFYAHDKGTLQAMDDSIRAALEAAAPHALSAKVAEAKANNDHIIEGGDGYSAGFHYALHCIEGEVK